MARVRTNIEIEETYVEEIKRRYGAKNKTEAVDMALRALSGAPMTREEMLAMEGAFPDFELPEDTIDHLLDE